MEVKKNEQQMLRSNAPAAIKNDEDGKIVKSVINGLIEEGYIIKVTTAEIIDYLKILEPFLKHVALKGSINLKIGNSTATAADMSSIAP